MNIYIKQLKILLWKNYKIKRVNHFYRNIILEFLFPLILILLLKIINFEEHNYDSEPSVEPVDIHEIFPRYSDSYIGFIIPERMDVRVHRNNFIEHLTHNNIFMDGYNSHYVNIETFSDEESLKTYKAQKNIKFLAEVQFYNYTNYVIRVDGETIVDPNERPIGSYYKSRKSMDELESTEADSYLDTFAPIQLAVDQAIIQSLTNKPININTFIGKMSKPAVNITLVDSELDDSVLTMTTTVLPLAYILIFINLMKSILVEKEKRQEEGLITIGIHPSALWLSWEIWYLPMVFFNCLVIVAIEGVITFSSLNIVLTFFFVLCYGLSITSLSVFLTKIFKKVRTAILITSFFFFSSNLIVEYTYKLGLKHPIIEKVICFMLSPINFSLGMGKINTAKYQNQKISFTNLLESGFGTYLLLMALSILFYHFLVLVFDFFSNRTFTFFKKSGDFTANTLYLKDYEKDPTNNGSPLLEVKDIFKLFKNRNNHRHGKYIPVLNGVSFNVYNNEIFAILGHNGAGKSTLIKIMTGLLKADHGSIHYEGLNINTNLNRIRKNIGICLQDNILYDNLTVEDNFKLFYGIKDVPSDMDAILDSINLTAKRYSKPRELSGGQKRKLCIGLALIGNPKFIFLDEPTTSLDPLSRRKIWELLLKIRDNRIIFLCTHFMDEADILADRKMILSKGTIRCIGSSVYLKNHFNMKYKLNVEADKQYKNTIEKVLLKHVPEAKFYSQENKLSESNELNPSNGITSLTWELPMQLTYRFSELFHELEKLKEGIIHQFSLDAPYLEELFIRLTSENFEGLSDSSTPTNENESKLPKMKTIPSLSKLKLTARLTKYRFKMYFRRKTFLLIYFVFPLVIIGFNFLSINNNLKNNQLVTFDEKVISSQDMYAESRFNYDVKNSNLKDTLTPELLERVFLPANSKDHNSRLFSEFTTKEMEILGQTIENGPYYVSSFTGNYINETLHFDIYYNDSMVHALPATINSLSNAVLSTYQINEPIITSSHPLEYYDIFTVLGESFTMLILICLCITLVVSFFGPLVVREREEFLWKQLKLNGVQNRYYWLSIFFTDFFFLYVLSIGIVVFSGFIGIEAFRQSLILGILLVVFLLSGTATLLFQYYLSLFFSKEESAHTFFILINFVPVFFYSIVNIVLSVQKTMYDSEILDVYTVIFDYLVFILVPISSIPCSIAVVLKKYFATTAMNQELTFTGLLNVRNGLCNSISGSILSIALYTWLILRHYRNKYQETIVSILDRTQEEVKLNEEKLHHGDVDVLLEYKRIMKEEHVPSSSNASSRAATLEEALPSPSSTLPVKMVQVGKEYPSSSSISYEKFIQGMKNKNPKYGEYHLSDYGSGRLVTTGVKNVTLGINPQECFGLIGPNGSGKSSLLNLITYTNAQTIGKIYYDGIENKTIQEDHFTMGYCPQNDSLWKELTLFEHLVMFIYLRGYSKTESTRYAHRYLSYCQLEDHRNKYPSELSGGTKRKLCILLALICFSNKVMLDEPSSGMDPATRRYIWNVLQSYIRHEHSSVIITTHSMEEAELLCDRIGILVNGELQCIGSAKHLKMKFNHTYVLEIQCLDVQVLDHRIKQDIKLLNHGKVICEIKSQNRIKYTFQITTHFSKIFEVMEKYKTEGFVVDYSFSQTTLEDIFLNFAKLQQNQEI